ncbi:hypothetical protein A0J57_17045 [Sphingobium sp. 22B]|uniref:antibiotic biosynthesis monooxygenase family protein n=1 Tax=unclassified Sphingobium TaxID=2611147 RepID=UPI000782DB4F|nr:MULTISPECIES: antibiotic biosynthesis monooxygenase [unclassified Sphingobium]KXU31496.1 hypothetical protein AXW74_12455 [Sphingobium sp. AM]KYC31150.1 hypothetical protein A0J57_17045 [Sphingobium sp. 22B]OAP31152.1 hypothetical protein A8O16_14950 [Sphingobium sp. 20006FA]
MVQESVEIIVDASRAAEFEGAMARAKLLFVDAPGCMDFALVKSVENAGTYRLLIKWETIAHHMDDFRNSDAFPEWRALVTPFLAAALSMQHFQAVAI